MSTEKSGKLQSVLNAVPNGYLVDAKWLTQHGIAYETFRDYVNRGWLTRVAQGVFQRPNGKSRPEDHIDWKACLLSMQHIMKRSLHLGSVSALAQQGYSHYLPLGETAQVWVYGADIPSWLVKLPLNGKVTTRKPTLFADTSLGLTENSANTDVTSQSDWRLIMSTPERAIFEAIDELPENESFHNLDMIFEGLTTLRPRLLAQLLNSCRKIKTKRLFFVFADKHNHAWNKQLDATDFDLGKGDRALVKGGKIHPRYRIMVPKDFVPREDTDGA
jgi:hypothetical protein